MFWVKGNGWDLQLIHDRAGVDGCGCCLVGCIDVVTGGDGGFDFMSTPCLGRMCFSEGELQVIMCTLCVLIAYEYAF